MTGGVTEMSADEAWLLLEMVHSRSGEPAATFQTRVAHVSPREGQPFPGPVASRARRRR
jgi:acyl-CoA thioester hydrolase